MPKILVLSENEALKDLLKKNEDCEFDFKNNEEDLNNLLSQNQESHSLLIVDKNISDLQLISLINSKNIPIILLSNDQPLLNKYHKLNKPFHISNLLEIINSITKNKEKKIFYLGDCEINLEARFIRKENSVDEVKLTELETKILDFLLKENDKSKNNILRQVWNYKNSKEMTDTGIVEVTINKLRKKIKDYEINKIINFKLR